MSLYLKALSLHLKAELEYKASFIFSFLIASFSFSIIKKQHNFYPETPKSSIALLCLIRFRYKLSNAEYMDTIGAITAAIRKPTIHASTIMIIGSMAAIKACTAISTSSS